MRDTTFVKGPVAATAYTVSRGGDHATFFVRSWSRRVGVSDQIAVTVTFVSSLGSGGHTWPNIGETWWRQWLAECEEGYIIAKLFGHAARQPSAERTAIEAQRKIIAMRRALELARPTAREAWDVIKWAITAGDTAGDIAEALSRIEPLRTSAWDLIRYETAPHVETFYRHLWRPWVEHLAGIRRSDLVVEVEP